MEKLSLGWLLKVIYLIISIKKVDVPMVDEDTNQFCYMFYYA